MYNTIDMNIIKPDVEIIQQEPGMIGALKHIEKVGRTCYKSEDKITEDSHVRFVDMLIEHGHLAMLEHATIYLTIPLEKETLIDMYERNPYSRVVKPKKDTYAYITTNSRVIIENDWQCDMEYMVPAPTKHVKRITVKFTTQIAISREFNRHRVNSMAEESSRYCNYTKDKFGNEISVSLPSWVHEGNLRLCQGDNDLHSMCEDIMTHETKWWTSLEYWLFANLVAEYSYNNLIKLGWTAQQARVVLPLDTKTELIHTAFIDDWQHFLDLRYHGTTGKPHPDAYEVASILHDKLKELKLIK